MKLCSFCCRRFVISSCKKKKQTKIKKDIWKDDVCDLSSKDLYSKKKLEPWQIGKHWPGEILKGTNDAKYCYKLSW